MKLKAYTKHGLLKSKEIHPSQMIDVIAELEWIGGWDTIFIHEHGKPQRKLTHKHQKEIVPTSETCCDGKVYHTISIKCALCKAGFNLDRSVITVRNYGRNYGRNYF